MSTPKEKHESHLVETEYGLQVRRGVDRSAAAPREHVQPADLAGVPGSGQATIQEGER